MKPEHLHILQHSLGVDQYGHGTQYRNCYFSDPTSDLIELCDLGFMADLGSQSLAGGMHCYYVTSEGKKAMRENSPIPPQLSRSQQRYRQFLREDSGMTFGEWLKCLTSRKATQA